MYWSDCDAFVSKWIVPEIHFCKRFHGFKTFLGPTLEVAGHLEFLDGSFIEVSVNDDLILEGPEKCFKKLEKIFAKAVEVRFDGTPI